MITRIFFSAKVSGLQAYLVCIPPVAPVVAEKEEQAFLFFVRKTRKSYDIFNGSNKKLYLLNSVKSKLCYGAIGSRN